MRHVATRTPANVNGVNAGRRGLASSSGIAWGSQLPCRIPAAVVDEANVCNRLCSGKTPPVIRP